METPTVMSMNTIPLVFDGKRHTIGGASHEDAYGIVVFLDALGVKGIWQTQDHAKVLKNWNNVYYAFSDELNHRLSGICLSAFSDTLIISMRGHDNLVEQPWTLVRLCTM
jgi:hypothetical protein